MREWLEKTLRRVRNYVSVQPTWNHIKAGVGVRSQARGWLRSPDLLR